MSLKPAEITAAILVSAAFVLVFHLIDRIRRDSLYRFPGPPVAKWTTWYRAYYDLVRKGSWVRHLEELHATYGPIVRVGPNELHFSDARAYGEIYYPGSRFHKDSVLYSVFGGNVSSVFTTPDPQEAAVARNMFAPYFSRRAVIQREDIIRYNVNQLVSRLKTFDPAAGAPVNLDNALSSATLDILTTFMFSRSFNMLGEPNFNHRFIRRIEPGSLNLWLMKYLPDPSTPIFGAFTRLMSQMNPIRDAIQSQHDLIEEELVNALKDFDLDDLHRRCDSNDSTASITPESSPRKASTDSPLYSFILCKVQEQILQTEKSKHNLERLQRLLRPSQLVDEGLNLRFAGTETVSNTCLAAFRFILTREAVLRRLVEELDSAWPSDSDITYESLEKLPYLTAVIKESLRLSHGVVSPKGRVVGPGDAIICGENIPSGTVVGISSTFLHLNPQLFPEPKKFEPERWIKSQKENDTDIRAEEVNSEKYLVSFSRGPRSCVGIHLAWCELYIVLGYLLRKLEFVLAQDEDPDLPLDFHDFFMPVYKEPLCVFVRERIHE